MESCVIYATREASLTIGRQERFNSYKTKNMAPLMRGIRRNDRKRDASVTAQARVQYLSDFQAESRGGNVFEEKAS